jgi:hypothetical protein
VVLFTSGTFQTKAAAVLLGEDGKLSLMSEEGDVAPIGFELPAMSPRDAGRLKMAAAPGYGLEVYEVSTHEFRKVASIDSEEFLYPWRQDEELVLMRATETEERDVARFEAGQGWLSRGALGLGGLVVSDPEVFLTVYGPGAEHLPLWEPLGPRTRPSPLAERMRL